MMQPVCSEPSLLNRLMKASPWFAAACLAFYFIGFGGADYLQEVRGWPRANAEVTATHIQLNPHMSDEYGLSIHLRVQPGAGEAFDASLYQVGPKGALEQRAHERFAPGASIRVRLNPEKPGQVVLDPGFAYGPFIIALIVALLIAANGFTLLSSHHEPRKACDQDHLQH